MTLLVLFRVRWSYDPLPDRPDFTYNAAGTATYGAGTTFTYGG